MSVLDGWGRLDGHLGSPDPVGIRIDSPHIGSGHRPRLTSMRDHQPG